VVKGYFKRNTNTDVSAPSPSMAGIIAVYGLVVSVLIVGKREYKSHHNSSRILLMSFYDCPVNPSEPYALHR